jgi:hypothetical protein
VQHSCAFPLSFGLIQSGGPDVLLNLSPVFSHNIDRARSGRVTPYAGASIVFNPGNPGTSVNGLFGIRVAEIAQRWDFVAEVQPGENTQLALGFVFRF